jgi:glycosyltransferase involved in cell wall biosynthesis
MKQRLLPEKKIGLFIASWHQPNIEAVRDLSVIAEKTPNIVYFVVGSVGGYFAESKELLSSNIVLRGLVTDEEKDIYLQIADFAVNPMSTGSGTNIKMFDYMAAGLPIVTTEVGSRGISLPDGFVVIASLSEFSDAISSVVATPKNIQKRLYIQQRYDWKAVGGRYYEALLSACERNNSLHGNRVTT